MYLFASTMITSYFKHAILIASACLVIQGCNLKASRTLKDSSIDPEITKEIKALNDKLFKALSEMDTATVQSMLADSLRRSGSGKINEMVGMVNGFLKSREYTIRDEYYTIGSANAQIQMPSGGNGDMSYLMRYHAMNAETYATLILPEARGVRMIAFLVYGKYNDQWKINILRFGQYDCLGIPAPELYRKARECYDKSYLLDAVMYMSLVNECLQPLEGNIEYNLTPEIKQFGKKIFTEIEAKYNMPYTFETIKGKPQLLRILPWIKDNEYGMEVDYLSNIDLNDTVALKAENIVVREAAADLFTGFDKDKHYILYRAVNELPNGNQPPPYFEMRDTLSELPY